MTVAINFSVQLANVYPVSFATFIVVADSYMVNLTGLYISSSGCFLFNDIFFLVRFSVVITLSRAVERNQCE